MSVFIAGNYFCVVNKNLAELPERYMYRGYTIAKQQVMTDEIKEKIRLARANQVITKESRLKSGATIKNNADIVCPHCTATGRYLGSMKKKHFDNCESKQ